MAEPEAKEQPIALAPGATKIRTQQQVHQRLLLVDGAVLQRFDAVLVAHYCAERLQ